MILKKLGLLLREIVMTFFYKLTLNWKKLIELEKNTNEELGWKKEESYIDILARTMSEEAADYVDQLFGYNRHIHTKFVEKKFLFWKLKNLEFNGDIK